MVCVFLTLFHLKKLHRDLTKANVEAVRVTGLITTLVNFAAGGNQAARAGEEENGADNRVAAVGGALEEQRKMRAYLDKMERDGVQRVKMFLVITCAYVLFWGPLFFVTLVHHPAVGGPLGHEITLHISYVHAIVNPTLFLVLHRGLRRATLDLCCGWVPLWLGSPSVPPPPPRPGMHSRTPSIALLKPPAMPAFAHPDSSMGNANLVRDWSSEEIALNPEPSIVTISSAIYSASPTITDI